MYYRSLAVAAAVLSMHVAGANAQSVYVAPGGVYVGGGPVYVTPAPNNGVGPYGAPTGYEYGPPAVPPVVVAPSSVYGPAGGYYDSNYYEGGYYEGGGYYNGGYSYGTPLSAYGAAPRPPAAVPYAAKQCAAHYGYRRQACY